MTTPLSTRLGAETPTERAVKETVTGFICFSRCLICGRRTPHELCHRHSTAMGGKWPDISVSRYAAAAYKRGFFKTPEVCEDVKCPQRENDFL